MLYLQRHVIQLLLRRRRWKEILIINDGWRGRRQLIKLMIP
jgi:hypothetical protein